MILKIVISAWGSRSAEVCAAVCLSQGPFRCCSVNTGIKVHLWWPNSDCDNEEFIPAVQNVLIFLHFPVSLSKQHEVVPGLRMAPLFLGTCWFCFLNCCLQRNSSPSRPLNMYCIAESPQDRFVPAMCFDLLLPMSLSGCVMYLRPLYMPDELKPESCFVVIMQKTYLLQKEKEGKLQQNIIRLKIQHWPLDCCVFR